MIEKEKFKIFSEVKMSLKILQDRVDKVSLEQIKSIAN